MESDNQLHDDSVYRPTLPVEVLGIVAKYLIATDLDGTCAALSLTCHAVRDEVLPTLYRTLVGFAAKWYGKFDSSSWGDGPDVPEGATTLGPREQRYLDKMMPPWLRLRRSAGSEWVEFFAMPPFMWTTEGEEAFGPGGKSPFQRLKAFFAPIYRPMPNGAPLPIIDVGLRPAYQFGGDGLISLARGIMQGNIYLVLPPFVTSAKGVLWQGLDDIPFNNAHTITSTLLGEDIDDVTMIPLVHNILRESYEFGGNDLHDLARIVTQMGEIGGIEVQKALHSPKGMHVMATTYSRTNLPEVEDIIAKLGANPLSHNIFRPRIVALSTLGDESPDAMALTVVEMLHWMRLEPDPEVKGMTRSTVICDLALLDTVDECVRALQTLCKTKPDAAKLLYAFEFDPSGDMDYAILISQTKAILARVRAMFIRACRHISIADIGIFMMTWHSDGMGDFCWTVQAGSSGDCIDTTLEGGDRMGILHRDFPRQ